jgi:hypothetical protein
MGAGDPPGRTRPTGAALAFTVHNSRNRNRAATDTRPDADGRALAAPIHAVWSLEAMVELVGKA